MAGGLRKNDAAETAPPDLAALRPLIEERVYDLRTAFAGSPDEQRAALRLVLKEERLLVSADPDPGVRFRVNGPAPDPTNGTGP